jgi:hypothetical protein
MTFEFRGILPIASEIEAVDKALKALKPARFPQYAAMNEAELLEARARLEAEWEWTERKVDENRKAAGPDKPHPLGWLHRWVARL